MCGARFLAEADQAEQESCRESSVHVLFSFVVL